MNTEHFDIGTIQAFLDGELAHERVSEVSTHIAACDNCALMLATAEDESAIVFPALEREFNTLVPTQRLWNKINDSITVEKENAPFWQKAWAYVSLILVNPSIAVAASVLIVFALVATLLVNRTSTPTDIATGISQPKPLTTNTAALPTAATNTPPGDIVSNDLKSIPQAERAAYRSEARPTAAPAVVRTNATALETLPGEESYVKTIATLSKSVEGQKDTMMRPSERVSYERDMAVVNDSIAKMRQEVKKNPKNESAKQVLYSSYQNKIDLLNSVSQKEELMASLNR